MGYYPCPKPVKRIKTKRAKPTCDNPSCSRESRIKYKGYFTYKLCLKCYREWYAAFCEWVHNTNNLKCEQCRKKKPLTVHHIPKRSQGGRHTKDHGHSWCDDCHKPEHGH
jgi:hypothetical protein